MPTKRARDLEALSPGATPSPHCAASTQPRESPAAKKTKGWSAEEERRFLEMIDTLVKKHLWSVAKEDELVSARGANGVRSHWDALYKKWSR